MVEFSFWKKKPVCEHKTCNCESTIKELVQKVNTLSREIFECPYCEDGTKFVKGVNFCKECGLKNPMCMECLNNGGYTRRPYEGREGFCPNCGRAPLTTDAIEILKNNFNKKRREKNGRKKL